MELSLARCESIMNTLPIGFYTGRRINVKIDKEAPSSYYDMMEDSIVISYPIIAHRMKVMPEGSCDEEEAVRSMMYHEVAHAILTPSLNNTYAVNCVEDERIETVLKHYFHGVNFRKQLFDIHGGKIPQATDVKSAFFNAVRFGLGTDTVQKEVQRIINKFAPMNRTTDHWSKPVGVSEYENEIADLYKLVQKEFRTNREEFQPKGNSGESEPQEMDKLKEQKQGSGKSKPSNEKGEKNKDESEDGEGEENEESESQNPYGEEHECSLTSEQVKRMVGASLGKQTELEEEQVAKLNEFQKTVEMIIGNFNKKNKGGSGINAYSGVFNPRAVARKDYRYFERAMTTQGNNKFGTCHLNLIIDCSGSYYDNVNITNGILAVLSEIERKNRNFSMDVAFINHEFKLCQTVSERKMTAWGGNTIPDNMKEILMKLQKPNTCNYTIVLFDGDAICQGYYDKDCNKMFGVFDMKQTTLITDPDNERYMNPPFTSTKVVVTQNYTKELIDHIIHALTIAFG